MFSLEFFVELGKGTRPRLKIRVGKIYKEIISTL